MESCGLELNTSVSGNMGVEREAFVTGLTREVPALAYSSSSYYVIFSLLGTGSYFAVSCLQWGMLSPINKAAIVPLCFRSPKAVLCY